MREKIAQGVLIMTYNNDEENYFNNLTPEIAQTELMELVTMLEEHPDYEVYFPKNKK